MNLSAEETDGRGQRRNAGVVFELSQRGKVAKDLVVGSEVGLKQIFPTARHGVHRPLEAGEGDLLVENLHPEIVAELQLGDSLPAEMLRDRRGIVQTDKRKRGDTEHHEQNQPVAGGYTDEERQADRPEFQNVFPV